MKKFTIKLIALLIVFSIIPVNAYELENTRTTEAEVSQAQGADKNETTASPFQTLKYLEKTIAPPDKSFRILQSQVGTEITAASEIVDINGIMTGMERTDASAINFYKTPANIGISESDYNAISAQATAAISGMTTDYDKVHAIYSWVSDNIYYDYYKYTYKLSTADLVATTFKTKLGVCEGYAELTNCMLRAIGIPSKVIIGFANGSGNLTNADATTDDLSSNHSWNEVYFDANDGNGPKWQVIDTTWGSGNTYYKDFTYVKRKGVVNYNWFLPSSNYFSLTHLTQVNEFNYKSAFYSLTPTVVPNIYSNANITNGTFTIPAGTKYIGANAFKGLTGLTSITIPSSVEGIAYGAFENCTNLKTINLGLVKLLHIRAFFNVGVATLNLPDTVKHIYRAAFSGCNSISTITCSGANSYFKVVNDVLYNADMTKLILYPNASVNTTYTIPDTVTSISDSMFKENAKLQTINIGSGVKTIGNDVFMEMEALVSIAIPDNVIRIGLNAFNATESLKTATIGKNVHIISWCAFAGCNSLESITVDPLNAYLKSVDGVLYDSEYDYESGQYILDRMVHFPASSKQTTVTIPAFLTKLGSYALWTVNQEKYYSAFSQDIQSFILENGNTTYSVENGIWYNADKSEIIMIPSNIQSKTLDIPFTSESTYINSDTFGGLRNVESISFAQGFVGLSNYAFKSCKSLKSILLPSSLLYIANNACYGLETLKEVKFASNTADTKLEIGDNAFALCFNLEAISLPIGTTKIGYYAFDGISMGYIYVPDTVTSIGNYAIKKGVVILGTANSATNAYAINNGNTFVSSFPYIADVIPSLTANVGAGASIRFFYYNSTPFTIQWYKNSISSKAGATEVPGMTTFSCAVGSATPGTYYYYAEVKNANGTVIATSSFSEVRIKRAGEYFITYNLSDGVLPENAQTSYLTGTPYTLPIPAKEGWDFNGWFTNATFSGYPVTAIVATDSGNKTYYAKWTAKTYTYSITYNLDGGTLSVSAAKSYVGGTGCTLPRSTRAHYMFDGWFENPEFTGTVVSKITTTEIGNKTYYAKWTLNFYKIFYYSNGGTLPDTSQNTYNEGITYTLPIPTKENYVFGGWYSNSTFTGTAVEAVLATDTGIKSYYAKWTGVTYSITYNLNNGTLPSQSATSYINGTSFTLPKPTRAHYKFEGWYDNASFSGIKISAIRTTETGDKTYYANWTRNTHTIAYVLSGGTLPENAQKFYNEGETYTLPVPTKAGCVFGGWYSTYSHTGNPITKVLDTDTGYKTFYAKWISSPCIVTFKDGKAIIKTQTIEKGKVVTSFKPVKAGYTFVGWYKEATFVNVFKLSTIINANKTIYARFVKNLSKPSSFGAVKVSSGKVKISWAKVSGLTYEVEYSKKSTSGFTKIASVTNVKSYTKTGLKVGTKYYFRVRAFKIVNNVKVYSGYTLVKGVKS